MKLLKIIGLILGIYGCSPKTIPNSVLYDSCKTKLPSEFYLKNRVTSCNEAVEYMKSVFIKDSVNTNIFSDGKKFIPIATLSVKIVGEVNKNKLNDLQYFYVDLDCLSHLKLEDLLGILLSENQKKNALMQIKYKKLSRFIFDISIENLYCFNFIVKNVRVENMMLCKTENSHGN